MHLKPFVAVTAVLLSISGVARADGFITFDLNASFLSGGSINGTLLLDSTQNAFTQGQFTVNSEGNVYSLSGLPFPNQQANYLEEAFSSAVTPDESVGLLLYLPISSLAGYDGSAVCSLTVACGPGIATYFVNAFDTTTVSAETVIDGSVSPVPEPSSVTLLGTGVLGVAGVLRKQFT